VYIYYRPITLTNTSPSLCHYRLQSVVSSVVEICPRQPSLPLTERTSRLARQPGSSSSPEQLVLLNMSRYMNPPPWDRVDGSEVDELVWYLGLFRRMILLFDGLLSWY